MRILAVWFVLLLLGLALPAAADTPEPTLGPTIGLNALAALTDDEFARNALQIVAASDNGLSGDWQRIKQPLAILAHGDVNLAAVWFARPDGTYFSVAGGRERQTLRDRAYFAGLIAGHPVTGFQTSQQ